MPKGGRRAGAGHPPMYDGGTAWVRVPLPVLVHAALGSDPRDALLAMLRAARPDLPWTEPARKSAPGA